MWKLRVFAFEKPTSPNFQVFGVSRLASFETDLVRRLMWTLQDHGDHIVITGSRGGNGGGLVMLGRSDGVLCVLPALALIHP